MKRLEDIREEFGIHFKDSEGELEWMMHEIYELNMQHLAFGMFIGSFIGIIILVIL